MKLLVCILCGQERTNWLNPALVEWLLAGKAVLGVDAEVSLVLNFWPVDHARNVAVERALSAGADWCLQIDNDTVPHPRTLAAIALADRRGLDVLGFAYPILCDAGICPSVLAGEIAQAKHDADFEEVPAFGSGCMAVRMSVFERLSRPFFQIDVDENDSERVGRAEGEDMGFCRRARTAGVRLHIARGVAAGHLRTVNLLKVYESNGRQGI